MGDRPSGTCRAELGRAVMRRTSGTSEQTISVGAITIDLVGHVVTREGEEIHLTPIGFDLLRVLATNQGWVLTHRQLLERVWGGYAAENAQQLRVYISYLRRKLEADPASPTLIVTEPGIGYRLRP
ncbi:MAG: winged helix-turn-helix domain-containing protein [Thermomicrobiales bacterium]